MFANQNLTMKKINELIEGYNVELLKTESKKLKRQAEYKQKTKLAKTLLNELRNHVRSFSFDSIDEEVLFFKYIKPQVCGELKFYKKQLDFILEKPTSSIESQKEYIQKELRKLEVKKKKNLQFYKYIKREETAFDEMYFTRGNEQLELFSMSDFVDVDPSFSTSHDHLACEVVTYDLLTEFYKQELHCLSNLEVGLYSNNHNAITNIFNWSGSKTDLVELIYALKFSGVINSGNVSIKQLTDFFGEVFSVDLNNYYKTYNEIRNRTQNQTKFISKLSLNLIQKLEMDED